MNLKTIKGIGPKTSQILEKMQITSVEDLVTYYPYRYEIIRRSKLSELKENDEIIMDGVVEQIPTISFFGKRKNRMQFMIQGKENRFQIVIFNRAFLKSKLLPNTPVTVIGKYDKNHNRILARELRFGLIEKETIERVYHIKEGITNKILASYIDTALTLPYQVEELLPDYLNERYHFIDKIKAIKEIHHPVNPEILKEARKKLIYEELFSYMVKVSHLKQVRERKKGIQRKIPTEKVNNLIKMLPFSLTEDQKQSLEEIKQDLEASFQMNRLLQGDVGSGKTIVAFLSLYMNYLSGYQGAMMAPTEILARQHYESLRNLLKDSEVRVCLLIGNMKSKERKECLKELEMGKVDIVIGTHALISEDVKYSNLGLIITDEQHRFGVHQRTSLMNKGKSPDMLSMSATPIPRTYALTLYGDMDLSNIYAMPNGRKKVITEIKKESEIKDVLTSMYNQLQNGHQIYVIAPLIEGEDEKNKNDVETLTTNMKKAFGKKYQIASLHGKMSASEKEQVMNDFSSNKTQILISTTVIEVGVDVKNATMIVIFNAEQFGLATLHQLRGRVGRNQLQSYCLLISNQDKERLQILVKTNDGFEISEEDFKMRGSGDLFGSRQSGDMIFKIADLKRDYKTLMFARKDSEEFLKKVESTPQKYKKLFDKIVGIKKYVS